MGVGVSGVGEGSSDWWRWGLRFERDIREGVQEREVGRGTITRYRSVKWRWGLIDLVGCYNSKMIKNHPSRHEIVSKTVFMNRILRDWLGARHLQNLMPCELYLFI